MCITNNNKFNYILRQTLLPNTILPKIKLHSNKILKNNNNITCSYYKILESQGCTNNIYKNGNKIWYVLHNLVENMSIGILTTEECDNINKILNIKNSNKLSWPDYKNILNYFL